MEAIKFTLRGRTAFFKKPEVNSYLYFTYGHIHKVALVGIFGAILGYKGYNQMKKDDQYPEFYQKLKDIKISIVPNNKNGIIDKKINIFNNSVGYASQEKGGNLIIKEQWLENPSWEIYLLLNDDESQKIANALMDRTYIYLPYLGKNDHLAEITNIKRINNIKTIDRFIKIDSFFKKNEFKYKELDLDDLDDLDDDNVTDEELIFKYEEMLPVGLDLQTNRYKLEGLVYTNKPIEKRLNCEVYEIEGKILTFI
ncbi:type I-B CRISPR-associated protein Cas5b [Clostridium chauvoei]|uniref:type I-B CRISPR-associated protein Cas5b n=1 Tax=Clostridium chauvoei TaxID=46867 RepID=UPI001C85E953|nr:type I-B CRISPR-associated protein Cas5b [Clostridium chauvoei]MBX7410252.1 type I-B CRISPR-associated protein Cas5b [Clostridium chauvoei]